MTPADATALAAIQGFAGAGRMRLSVHFVRDRGGYGVDARNVVFADVRRALVTATGCRLQPNGCWKVTGGKDTDGDDLTVVVVLAGEVLVVTVF